MRMFLGGSEPNTTLIREWAHVLKHVVCTETAPTRCQGELSCVTMWSIINLPLNYTSEANVRNGHYIGGLCDCALSKGTF